MIGLGKKMFCCVLHFFYDDQVLPNELKSQGRKTVKQNVVFKAVAQESNTASLNFKNGAGALG